MKFNGIDLGSIELVSVSHGKFEFQGLSADKPKLDDADITVSLGAGSSFLALDTASVYMFHKESKTWYQL